MDPRLGQGHGNETGSKRDFTVGQTEVNGRRGKGRSQRWEKPNPRVSNLRGDSAIRIRKTGRGKNRGKYRMSSVCVMWTWRYLGDRMWTYSGLLTWTSELRRVSAGENFGVSSVCYLGDSCGQRK